MRTVDVMRESMGAAWFNRGIAALHAGRLAEAAASLSESAAIGREMEDADLLGYVLEGYAALAAATGRPGLAARLSGASGAALTGVDSVLEAFEAAMRERTAASVREAIGDAAADVERAAGAALSIDEALDLALSIGTDLAAARSSEPAV